MQDSFYFSSCFDDEDLMPLNLCKSNAGSRSSSPDSSATITAKDLQQRSLGSRFSPEGIIPEPSRAPGPSITLTPIGDQRHRMPFPTPSNVLQHSAALHLANQRALLELIALQNGVNPLLLGLSSSQAPPMSQPQSLPYPTFSPFSQQTPGPSSDDFRQELGRKDSLNSSVEDFCSSSPSFPKIELIPTATNATTSFGSVSPPEDMEEDSEDSIREKMLKSPHDGSVKDAKYYQRRQRNNESARRSREKRKEKEREKEARAVFLEGQYNVLVKNFVHYTTLLNKMESMQGAVFGKPPPKLDNES